MVLRPALQRHHGFAGEGMELLGIEVKGSIRWTKSRFVHCAPDWSPFLLQLWI